MQRGNKVLGRMPRPTKNTYRGAVSQIIQALQSTHGLNDPELAERLGCSSPTIANARNRRFNLDGVTLANIEFEFGPGALDPFLALGGARAVPTNATCLPDANPVLALLAAATMIIEAQKPDSPGGPEITAEEVRPGRATLIAARRALDALIELSTPPALSVVEGEVA